MARKKDSPQKAALREMMNTYLKENDVKIKDGTDVNCHPCELHPHLLVFMSSFWGAVH